MDSSSAAAGDDVDRISALSDNLLQAILSFVRQAPDITATAALSRRWRHVWVGARDLSLEDFDLRNNAAARRFAGFVDWVLAQRGDADMDSLHIVMHWQGCPSLGTINGWIRYGMQRVVGDFHLCIPSVGKYRSVELPINGRAASMSLNLPGHGLRFPAVARYEELEELTLHDVSFKEDEDGRALCDFLSSSCPRLRKLDIQRPRDLAQLVLHVEALQELRISFTLDLQALDVTAPNLLVLKLELTYSRITRIIAPRLQEVRMFINSSDPQDLHGLTTTSIRRLGVIQMHMHAQYRNNEDDNFWLLRNCPAVEDVEVSLTFLHDGGGRAKNHVIDAMLEGAETFPNVTSMRVNASFASADEDHLVASMASLLIRFPRLRSLCIELNGPRRDVLRAKCFCDALGKWTDNGQITMEFLEDVKISGFTGEREELDLVSLLFKSSSSVIKSMTLSAASKRHYAIAIPSFLRQKMEDEDDDGDDSLEPIHPKLMDMPSTNRGHWQFGKNVCNWVC